MLQVPMYKAKHLTTFYRPQRFAELKGQDHIKKVLTTSIEEEIIGKAYLFSGTRGVGKTSVARIFAKAINCRNGPASEPCNRCDICVEITNGTCLDVMEIDGASHTGVDNVRKLIEDISLSPIKCKYRVIIIDEVHMLSKSAFNALLKTLEEPPHHVVFILATTEVHKIPATIISRCQHFIFKKLTTLQLVEHLKDVLEKESIAYEEDALFILAQKGGGSVRDCLSMLSQLVAISDEKITASLVRDVLGIAPEEAKIRLVEYIAKKDLKGLVKEVRNLLDQGIDIPYFLQEFVQLWRNLFLIKSGGAQILEEIESLNDKELLKKIADLFSIAQIHGAWQMLIDAQSRMERAQDPVLFLELLFVNMAYLPDLISISDMKHHHDLEISKKDVNLNLKGKRISVERKDEPSAKEEPKTWNGFLEFLKKKNKLNSFPHINICDGELTEHKLQIKCPALWASRLKADSAKFRLFEDLVKEYFGRDVTAVFVPFQGENKKSLKDRILEKPIIKNITEEFHAKIVDVYPRKKEKSNN